MLCTDEALQTADQESLCCSSKAKAYFAFFFSVNNATFFQQGIISVVTNSEKQRCRREAVSALKRAL